MKDVIGAKAICVIGVLCVSATASALSGADSEKNTADQPWQTEVFVSGDDGYHTCRIPSLLVTKAGTLPAFCEGRKNGRSEAGDSIKKHD